jgi:hypothetical protein
MTAGLIIALILLLLTSQSYSIKDGKTCHVNNNKKRLVKNYILIIDQRVLSRSINNTWKKIRVI